MKSCLKDNDAEMYSIYNEGKSVVAERFVGTFKSKIYKYMISILENVYIEYNNKYHSTIKTMPIDVSLNTNIDFGIGNNDKDPKLKVGDNVRISKYQNIFAKDIPNWSEDFFVIRKVKNTEPMANKLLGFLRKRISKRKSNRI